MVMDPEQRTRLLRSARKLEALLGTTPQVIDHNLYLSQFSSSASSLDSTSSDKDRTNAWMRPDVRTLFSPSDNYDRKPKRSKSTRQQPLAQPLLLRMSAVPIDHHRRQSTSSIPSLTRPSKLTLPTPPPPPLVTPFERRKLKVDSVIGPLSPFNKSHFPAQAYASSVLDLPLTPTPASPVSDSQDPAPLAGLSDREKRIKMAKVQRMMGENIPPELVFRDSEKTLKKLKKTTRSTSALAGETNNNKETETVPRPRPLPTLPTTTISPRSLPPTPQAPMITQTTTKTTTSSPLLRQLSLSMKQRGRKSRPRSLTLGTASAFVAANIKLAQHEKQAESGRGTVSLDESRHCRRDKDADADGPFMRERKDLVVLRTEVWRRKEKEWSGEWNVKDMEEVARALRGLRAT